VEIKCQTAPDINTHLITPYDVHGQMFLH